MKNTLKFGKKCDIMQTKEGMKMGRMTTGASGAASIWIIISFIVAVVGGIVLYFTFLRKKNDGKFTGFLGWVYDFLSFKKMMVEDILRVCYLISAILITLLSFVAGNLLSCLMVLILGNIAIRMTYELTLVILIICRNTTSINSMMKKEALKSEEETK